MESDATYGGLAESGNAPAWKAVVIRKDAEVQILCPPQTTRSLCD